MSSICHFEFDRAKAVYYTGETISGRIRLITKKLQTVNEAFIEFHGEAQVLWQEHKKRRQESNNHEIAYIENYYGSEVYLHTKTVLLSGRQLLAGTHFYTFSIPLPLQCPSSCFEKYGKIEYKLSCTIERSYHFNQRFERSLTVINSVDLNQNPEYLLPMRCENIKYFCCWPCLSGPVICTLIIPNGAYVAAQKINFTLELDNQTLIYNLEAIEYKIQQIFKFRANHPHYSLRQHINTFGYAQCLDLTRRLSKCIFEHTLTVPPVIPTSSSAGILTVDYIFELSIKTGGCYSDIKFEIPIVIGTVPLQQTVRQRRALPEPTVPTNISNDLPPASDLGTATTSNVSVQPSNPKDSQRPIYTTEAKYAAATAPELVALVSTNETPVILSAPVQPSIQSTLLPTESNKSHPLPNYSTFSK